jgi:hypothetical protein
MDDFLLFTFAFFLEPASAKKSAKKSNQRCFCQVKSRKEKGKSFGMDDFLLLPFSLNPRQQTSPRRNRINDAFAK